MNIILLIIDTLRYDHLGANQEIEGGPEEGEKPIRTPNLDRLAERCWNFTNAYSASFPTIPHRTDVITGRYGAPFHPWKLLDCDVPTIPRILAEEGYRSQLIHDTPHLVNGGHRFDYPFNAWKPVRGAEVDRAWFSDSWEYMDNWADDPLFEGYLEEMSREEILKNHHALRLYSQTNRGREREEEWNAAKLFRTGAQFLKDNAARENFFLWLDCFDPHEPWDAPPEYVKVYDDDPDFEGKIDPRSYYPQVRNDPGLPDQAKERIKNTYKAKVTFMDRWLGEFLDEFERQGLDEKTALLLTADHGTNVGDREGHPFGKTNPPLENEAHVPLLLYVPGEGSGNCDSLVQPQDVFATLIEQGGAEIPQGTVGEDLLKIAQGPLAGRDFALSGGSVDGWRGRDPEEGLFSVFDGKWCLRFAPKPEDCKLTERGDGEDVSEEHPQLAEGLYQEALAEIKFRGLDPALVDWLESEGEKDLPQDFQITDAHPAPPGWNGSYWNRPVEE